MIKANLRTAQTSKDSYKLHVPHIKTASDGLNNLLPGEERPGPKLVKPRSLGKIPGKL